MRNANIHAENGMSGTKSLEDRIIETWSFLQEEGAISDYLPDGWESHVSARQGHSSISLCWDGEEVIRIEREADLPLQKVVIPKAFADRRHRLLEFIAGTGDRIAVRSEAKAQSERHEREQTIIRAIDSLP